jgi:ParB family chromosome partitioning protein
MTVQTHIPLNQLVAWPGNVRKTRNKGILAEVKASIKADGLLQNLVVLPHGKKFAVVAGETRLLAMQELAAEKHLPGDFAVKVEFTTKENAHAVSLAENTIRENMNAADEAEAFAKLVEKGHSKLKIGERYGRTERYVEQRLKIAECSKASLKAYRDGLITIDQLHAFTVAKNHKEQDAVLKQVLGNGYFDRSPDGIREALKGDDTIELDDIRLKVVPPEDYVAAGGVIVKRDLWSDDNGGVIDDVPLLNKLVGEKCDTRVEAVKKEGWLWVEPRVTFGYSDKAQFTTLEPDFKPLPPKKQESSMTSPRSLRKRKKKTRRWIGIVLNTTKQIPRKETSRRKSASSKTSARNSGRPKNSPSPGPWSLSAKMALPSSAAL